MLMTKGILPLWKSLLSLLLLLAVLYVNYLANALPINGLTTGEVSGRYGNYFVPAGFTFAIWGLIYLLLIGFVLFLFLGSSRLQKDQFQFIDKSLPWFWLSCFMNGAWIFSFHYGYFSLSVVLMVVLLLSLIRIYMIYGEMLPEFTKEPASVFLHLPFRVYLAWISVATLANLTLWMVAMKWNLPLLTPEYWAVLLIIIAGILGFLFLTKNKDLAYTGVIIWALFGIYKGQQESGVVSGTAMIVLLLLLIIMVSRGIVSRKTSIS